MKNKGLTFTPASGKFIGDQWVARGVMPLLDCVVTGWTATEARTVYGALKGWTQEETAAQGPIDDKRTKPPTRQAVAKALVRTHWTTVESVLKKV